VDSKSDEQSKVERLLSAEGGEHAGTSGDPARDVGPHFLFVVGVATRSVLALMLVSSAVYILNLLDTWGVVAWLVLGVTSAGLVWVLLDDAFDIEGTLAREVALAASFDPDPFGVRAAAVRAYTDEFVHAHGRAPRGSANLKQPGTERSFRTDFSSTNASPSRYANVLLISLQRGLQVVAANLLVVTAARLLMAVAG
jgi:hypothetical protein